MDTLDLFCASVAWGLDTPGLARWLRDPSPGGVPDDRTGHRTRLRRDPATRCQLDRLRRNGWQLLSIREPDYPHLLREISDPPGVLYLRGSRQCLQAPALAMVGARHGSPGGCRQACEFARALAAQGFVIVSGLAHGVDGAAHRGALESGHTIAVLGHGPDSLYPASHRALAEAVVAQGGLLITEFPPGQGPRKALFPQRNRLISGLCQATLVVEAAERSGSLVTARLAAEQGREVFAMPGAVGNPFARGCHQLLRDGAQWLEQVADVLSVIPAPVPVSPGPARQQGSAEHPILVLLGEDTMALEALAQQSGLPMAQLAGTLGELELSGQLERVAGGYRRATR